MRVLAKALGNSDTDIDEIRKDSIRNVYRTKGRVDMEEILRDYNSKKYFQDDYDYKDFIFDDEYDY